MRPRSADTSEPAWVKRKMLSMKSSTSLPSWSRKYSATERPGSATRARPRGRRLVHRAIDEGASRTFGPTLLLRVHVHVGLDHLVIEVVAFARTLTDAGEHGITAVRLCAVVDQFLHGH